MPMLYSRRLHTKSVNATAAFLDAATADDNERQGGPVKAAYFKEHGGSDRIVYGDYRDPAPARQNSHVPHE